MTPTLDELERLLAEATPGPWHITHPHILQGGDYENILHRNQVHCLSDEKLIIAAVNALPALIAAARERDRLTTENERLTQLQLDWIHRRNEQVAEKERLRARAGAVDDLVLSYDRLTAESERLREALEIIAGKSQCIDNLMGNVDIARAALAGDTP